MKEQAKQHSLAVIASQEEEKDMWQYDSCFGWYHDVELSIPTCGSWKVSNM